MPSTLATMREAAASVHDRGFAVLPAVLPEDLTNRIARIAMTVAEEEMARHPDDAFTVDHGAAGQHAPRKVDYPFLKHPEFRAFILDTRLQSVVDAILGQPGYLMRDQIFCKPLHFGTAKPYHQENASLGYQPADQMIVTWIALDDATEDNGCLRVIEGSHRHLWEHQPMPGAAFNHVPPNDAIDLNREVALPVPAGGVVILHSQVLHASRPNPSGSWRRAYTAHWVTATIECATEAQRYGYSLAAGGGERCSHRAP